MNETLLDSQSILGRLNRIESAYKRQRFVMLILLIIFMALLIIGQTPRYYESLYAQNYSAIDGNGNTNMILGNNNDGSVGLSFKDKRGQVRVLFGVLKNGQSGLMLMDENGVVRIDLGFDPGGNPVLYFRDKTMKHRVELGVLPNGKGILGFTDENGRIISKIP